MIMTTHIKSDQCILRDGKVYPIYTDNDNKQKWVILGTYTTWYNEDLDGPLLMMKDIEERFPEYLI